MKTIYDYVLGKAPWLVRWIVYLVVLQVSLITGAVAFGWNALPIARAFVVTVVEEWAAPKIKDRDYEFKEIHTKVDSIARAQNEQGQDIREIRTLVISIIPGGPRGQENKR